MKYDVLGEGFRASLVASLGNKNTADRYFFAVRRLLSDRQFESCAELDPAELQRRLLAVKGKSNFLAAKNGLKWLQKYDSTLRLPDKSFFDATGPTKRNHSVRPAKTLYQDTICRKINALQNEKLKYAYRLMMRSALRVSETAAITKKDITIDGSHITVNVTHGKGGSNGRVECMDDPYLAKKLSAYMEAFDDDDRLFYAASTMKKRAHELGIECHDLRRVAAITYRREKKQEPEATTESADEATKDFLRHARFSTTKRYLYNRKLKVKPPREAASGPQLPAAVAATSGQSADPLPGQEAAAAPTAQPDPPISSAPPTDPQPPNEAATAPESPPEPPASSEPSQLPPLQEDPPEDPRPPAHRDKPRTLERISEHIRAWEDKYAEKIPLTISQQQDVTDAFFTLLESGDFAMRLRDHLVLEEILSSGFKNQMEVEESGGYYSPELRREVAAILFGCSEDLNDEDYEKYGYLAETDMLKDLASDTSHYGPVVVRFRKSHIKGRVTMTSGDSLPVAFGENVIASPTDHPSIGSIFLPGSVYGLLKNNRLNLKSPQQVAETIPPMDRFGQYIELQYHGQLTADDIESVFIGHPLLNPQPDLILKLKAKGIRVFKLHETDDGEEEIHEL